MPPRPGFSASSGRTDWVDGYAARHLHQVSELGKVLDPTADRLVFIVCGGAILIDGSVPTWFGVAVLVREIVVGATLVMLTVFGMKRFDVKWVGKAGTFALMFSLPAFLLAASDSPVADAGRGGRVGHRASRASCSSYYAAATYVPEARRALRGRARRAALMKAVIMAGGEGTRLRPLTSNAPKPMLPVANRPMMEHIVGLLRKHGFDEIVVTVAFLAQAIQTYFDDGSEFGVKMTYATENTPLGTAGSVGNARELLDERFLVISGDVLTDIDLSAILAFHDEREAMATIGLAHVENPLEFGIVITRDDGIIERFLEKPTWGQVFSDTINTGIYVLEPDDLQVHRPGQAGRLLERRVPPAARRRRDPRRRGRVRATGRTSARSTPTSAPTWTCSTAGSASTSRASRSRRRCGSARARRSIPTPRSIGPAVIGPGCASRSRHPTR